MRGLLGGGTLVALLAAGTAAGIASAQDGTEERTATVAAGTAGGDVVRVGDVEYELPAGEVFAVCIDGRTDDMDGSKLVPRPFVRTASDGWLAFPSVSVWATGSIAGAQRGDCFALDPEPITP